MNFPKNFIVAETGRIRDAGHSAGDAPTRSASAHFVDRAQASIELVRRLTHFRYTAPLVLAIPPGGVPIARDIADGVEGDLDVVLVRSLGRCGLPGRMAGAVDEYGAVHLSGSTGVDSDAEQTLLRREARRQLDRIRLLRERYIRLRIPLDPAGRVVIVVDDGLATPAEMWAVLASVRARKPIRLVCALPALPSGGASALIRLADEVICATRRSGPRDSADLYERVDPVSDEQVARLIARSSLTTRSGTRPGTRARTGSGSNPLWAGVANMHDPMDKED